MFSLVAFLRSEWTYLLTTRIVAGNDSAFSYVRLKYGSNLTDTVTGTIIYPDDFSFAEAGVGALNFGANYAVTQIDAATWEALEDMGCVFLPGASYLVLNTTGVELGPEGVVGLRYNYWTATAHDASKACRVVFDVRSGLQTPSNDGRKYPLPVRLAQDL